MQLKEGIEGVLSDAWRPGFSHRNVSGSAIRSCCPFSLFLRCTFHRRAGTLRKFQVFGVVRIPFVLKKKHLPASS